MNTKKNILLNNDPVYTADWKGYTIGELRHRRAIVEIKLEMEKEALAKQVSNMRKGVAFLPGSGSGSKIARKVLANLNYIDYGFIAYRLGSKLFGFFHSLKSLKRHKKR